MNTGNEASNDRFSNPWKKCAKMFQSLEIVGPVFPTLGKLAVAAGLLLMAPTGRAATGWFEDFVVLDVDDTAGASYWIGADPSSGTPFHERDFGVVTNLVISGCDMKYWSDSQDREGGAYYWSVDGGAEHEVLWSQAALGGNDYQGTSSTDQNVLSGLRAGAHGLAVWAKSWGSGQGDSWLSNGGNNYTAAFSLVVSYTISPSNGPRAGGNSVLITNCVPAIGDGADITNILVGSVGTTNIIGQGANWVAFIAPSQTSGVQEIVVESASGSSPLAGAYTVNPDGVIGYYADGWEETAGLPAARLGLGAATYSNVIHAAGGYTYASNVFCFGGTNWTEQIGLPDGLRNLSLCVYSDTLYAVSGTGSSGEPEDTPYYYEPSNSVWYSTGAAMPAPRTAMGVASYNGYLYAGGGYYGVGSPYQKKEAYRFDGSSWTSVADLPDYRDAPVFITFHGSMYCVGGAGSGGVSVTNVYRYDGTNWWGVLGLPAPRHGLGAAVHNDRLYVYGGLSNTTARSEVFGFDGTNWHTMAALPAVRARPGSAVLSNQMYCIGGGTAGSSGAMTNVYRYPAWRGGVTPSSGSWLGGYPVIVSGANLCDGTDVTNVTICGVSVSSIDSQSATQVVVTAGAGTPGLGDVRIYSSSYGMTVKSNAFLYFEVAPTDGPNAGGNTLTITNGVLGDGSDITNVLVGGVAATITDQGENWVTITMPAHATGTVDIAIQSASLGETLLSSAYAYNPSGNIPDPVVANPLPPWITLTNSWLNGTNGAILAGAAAGYESGSSVRYAGDVNGDGRDDFLVGAWHATPLSRSGAGETYLIYGNETGFPAWVTLTNTWVDGVNGTIFAGVKAADYCGISVSAAGDVNGDDLDDLLIGAHYADPEGVAAAGETYIVYGSATGFAPLVTLTNTWLDGTNGVLLAGTKSSGYSGYSVSTAGDVNGDGLSDVLVGAYYATPGPYAAGETYLVFGKTGGLPPFCPMTNTWLDGTNGVLLAGSKATDRSGFSVSGAGDVNGDGLDDLLIGAYDADPRGLASAGESYLIFGRTNEFPSWITLTNSWLDGTNGVILVGDTMNDYSGRSVSAAGDVNGDGLSDFLIGAYSADPWGRSAAGETYLIYGRTNAFPPFIILSGAWLDGTNGSILASAESGDYSGYTVGTAGDVNGDGLSDVLINAYGSVATAVGKTYLVYGRADGYSPMVTLTNTWLDGTNGVILAGASASDRSGSALGYAGDVNHDGLSDFMVAASLADPGSRNSAGETYLIYGRRTSGSSSVAPSSGIVTGGFTVVITGSNLGNGSDITNVTLCGAGVASIDSQSATQVVVTAGAGVGGVGDVAIYSVSFGLTVSSNAFEYIKAPQTIAFDAIPAKTYGDAPFDPGATASSGLEVSYAVSNPDVATNNGSLIYITGTGTCAIVATQSGNGTYLAALGVTNVMAVSPKGLTVSGATADNKAYDSTPAATLTGGSLVGLVDDDIVTLDNASTGTFSQAGVGVEIEVTSYMELGGADAGNYNLSQPALSADITKASQMLGSFLATNGSVFVETDVVGLSATASSGLGVSFAVESGPGSIAEGTNLSFTGGGLVGIVASQTGDANWNAAPALTNAYRVMGYYTLTIESAYGSCTPDVGIYTQLEESVITNQVTTPDTLGTTQYVCGGWSMSGNDPVSGAATSLVMTVTNDAVLTWLWTTNYYLTPAAGANGSIDQTAAWFANGEPVTITATPDAYYHFENWSGDASGSANPLNLSMDAPKGVTANFAAILTTNKPTPEWWLVHYGITNHFEEAVDLDADDDGIPTGDEYIMGTDPTNPVSYLHLDQISLEGSSCTMAWPCASNRVYDVQYGLTLSTGTWASAQGLTNLVPESGWVVITNVLDVEPIKHYRLRVRLP